MNPQDPKKKAPTPEATVDEAALQRSGAGAGTALAAMLKRRLMRPNRDAEPQLPDTNIDKTRGG
jgi:hypothetical protein